MCGGSLLRPYALALQRCSKYEITGASAWLHLNPYFQFCSVHAVMCAENVVHDIFFRDQICPSDEVVLHSFFAQKFQCGTFPDSTEHCPKLRNSYDIRIGCKKLIVIAAVFLHSAILRVVFRQWQEESLVRKPASLQHPSKPLF